MMYLSAIFTTMLCNMCNATLKLSDFQLSISSLLMHLWDNWDLADLG